MQASTAACPIKANGRGMEQASQVILHPRNSTAFPSWKQWPMMVCII
jgi:hypothetical protein